MRNLLEWWQAAAAIARAWIPTRRGGRLVLLALFGLVACGCHSSSPPPVQPDLERAMILRSDIENHPWN